MSGCGITGCDETTQVVEIVESDVLVDSWRARLADLRERGFECASEPIRNAFGNQIGTRYTCTGCDG